MSNTFRNAMAFGLLPVVVILDQITKYIVLAEPQFRALECLDRTVRCGKIELSSIFDLTMVWNRGMSFGTLQSEGIMRWVLVLVTVSIAIGFGVWLFRAARRLTITALTLIVAGAAGNVVDRVRFGGVVDFFDFSGPWFGLEIPLSGFFEYLEHPFAAPSVRDGMLGVGFPYVFNIADAGITIGAALLFLDQFLLSRETPKPVKTEDET